MADAVEIAPLASGGHLGGFLVSGRWPESTMEWQQLLVLVVRFASVPGMLQLTTIFVVEEEQPEDCPVPAVGLIRAEGTVIGDDALEPGHFEGRQPTGLFALHPPRETVPDLPEFPDTASGCLLLPGLPHLGLDHRASWAHVDSSGAVTLLHSLAGVDPWEDADTAVLAMLLAA